MTLSAKRMLGTKQGGRSASAHGNTLQLSATPCTALQPGSRSAAAHPPAKSVQNGSAREGSTPLMCSSTMSLFATSIPGMKKSKGAPVGKGKRA